MAGQHRARSRHVAGCAGGSPEVNTRCPGSRGGVPVVFLAEGRVDVAVFAFHVNFDLRVIRAQMALPAGFGFAGFGYRKPVSRMATAAAAIGAVHVDAADAHIGPGIRIQLIPLHFYHGSVAVITSGDPFRVTVHAVVQPGINFPDNFGGIGMFAEAELLGFIRVATGAILGCDHSRYGHHVFLGSVFQIRAFILFVMTLAHIRIGLVRLVTVIAGDIGAGMPAVRPVVKQPGMFPFVTFDTGNGFLGHASFNAKLFFFCGVLLSRGIGGPTVGHYKDSQTATGHYNSPKLFHTSAPFAHVVGPLTVRCQKKIEIINDFYKNESLRSCRH